MMMMQSSQLDQIHSTSKGGEQGIISSEKDPIC